MLHSLLSPLAEDIQFFNLFRYLTFRIGGGFMGLDSANPIVPNQPFSKVLLAFCDDFPLVNFGANDDHFEGSLLVGRGLNMGQSGFKFSLIQVFRHGGFYGAR